MAGVPDEVPVGDTSVVCFNYTLDGTLCEELVRRVPAHIYMLIADENVFALYGEQFLAKFQATGKTLFHMVLPSGETTKNRRVKEQVEDFMLKNKMNRDTCCIALGGGVIGDLTGYIAATFMRGVPFVQLPTTLLAMVDASVGGKTAVNTDYGKNLIGAFHQPTVVFMDMGFLDGFSRRDPERAEREFKAGIAEIIKTGAIWDASLFEVCEQRVEMIQRREHDVLNEIVRRSVAIKAEVVTLDPKEGGLRAILNWGHTIGHAVEGLMGMTDYAGPVTHTARPLTHTDRAHSRRDRPHNHTDRPPAHTDRPHTHKLTVPIYTRAVRRRLATRRVRGYWHGARVQSGACYGCTAFIGGGPGRKVHRGIQITDQDPPAPAHRRHYAQDDGRQEKYRRQAQVHSH